MSGSADRCIKLWNITNGKCLKTYDKGHNQEVFDIDVCDDNKKFVSVGGDKSIFLWDVFTANILVSYPIITIISYRGSSQAMISR